MRLEKLPQRAVKTSPDKNSSPENKGTIKVKTVALTLSVAIALVAVCLSSLPSEAAPGNWPQWRGPDGSGISNEKNLPSEWTPTKNIKWKTAIDVAHTRRRSCGATVYS